MQSQYRALYRSRSNRMISGVAGGLGEYFGIDVSIVRLLLVFGSLMGAFGPIIVTYVVLMLVLPETPEGYQPPTAYAPPHTPTASEPAVPASQPLPYIPAEPAAAVAPLMGESFPTPENDSILTALNSQKPEPESSAESAPASRLAPDFTTPISPQPETIVAAASVAEQIPAADDESQTEPQLDEPDFLVVEQPGDPATLISPNFTSPEIQTPDPEQEEPFAGETDSRDWIEPLETLPEPPAVEPPLDEMDTSIAWPFPSEISEEAGSDSPETLISPPPFRDEPEEDDREASGDR